MVPTSVSILAACCFAQDPQAPAVPVEIADAIRAAAFERSEVLANLRWLSDRIGPRLTGSPQLEAASTWVAERFAGYGLEVRREPWQIARGWRRVRASARVTAPVERALAVASAGWAPSTDGVLSLPVVDLERDPDAELAGRLVLVSDLRDALQRGVDFGSAAALLCDSRKDHALLDMDSAGPPFSVAARPVGFTTAEDFGLLRRLCEGAVPVTVELELANELSDGPVTVHDTIAELRGVGPAEQQIVVAVAALDSWDLGSGTIDNGAGAMVVLEAARILAHLPEPPARTLRFLLLAGEQQAGTGSARYVERHAGELARHAAGLVVERGSGGLRGLALHNQQQYFPLAQHWFRPVRDLGVGETSLRAQDGAQLVFQQRGVPVFAFVQDEAGFHRTHHSQADTFDKAVEADLMQAACVLATGLWAIAAHDGELPRFDAELAGPRRR